MFATKLDAALAARAQGFNVFPAVENTKVARIKNWQHLATSDEKQIREWWGQWPNDNVAGLTTDKLVLDIDVRNDGHVSFKEFMDMSQLVGDELTKTTVHKTQGGGKHVIYALPPHTHIKGGAHKFGRGLDLKSWNGYILLPGSTIDGKSYERQNQAQIALAPQWLIDKGKSHRQKTDAAGKRIVEEDDQARELFEQWMQKHAPMAYDGEIDDTTYKMAARGYDFGCSEQTVLEVVSAWDETNCFPQNDPDRLLVVVESAGRNREKAIGANHPSAPGFEPVEIDETKAPHIEAEQAARAKFYAIRADEGARTALTRRGKPLIKGILNCSTMSVLVGPPGGGKTFLAIDWSYHIAKGLEWAGRRTQQGAVVYLAAEAGHMILSRLAALEQHYGPLGDAPLYMVPCGADFAHGAEDAKALLALIRDIEKQSGQKVVMFVVDTLARVLAGGDENSSKDMGAIIRAVDFIREQADCHTLVIHHPNKAGTGGGRGHSNVLGGTDTEMQIDNHTLVFSKQRDMAMGADIKFKLVPVHIGKDDDGEPVTSCVVNVPKAGEDEPRGELTGRLRDVWDRLEAALLDADLTTFDMAFLRKIEFDNAPTRTGILKWMSELSENGYVKKAQRGQWVTANVTNVK
jgi:hypothetical protein